MLALHFNGTCQGKRRSETASLPVVGQSKGELEVAVVYLCMNSRVQSKINEMKKLSVGSKTGYLVPDNTKNTKTDGLSMAIHSKRDADTFIMELKAIRKRNN